MEQLPLKSVVLFIACGTMLFIIVFIFAKRQITRWALKSRGPHISVGYDAPKSLRLEIERRLKRVAEIHCEPKLLSSDSEHYTSTPETSKFLYRMKAVDAVVLLDTELLSFKATLRRRPGGNLRAFLLDQHQTAGALEGMDVKTINHFVDAYEHARHDPQEFQQPQYQEYMDLLTQMIEHVRNRKNKKRDLQHQSTPVSTKEDVTDGSAVGGIMTVDAADEAEEETGLPPLASPDSIDVGIPAEEMSEESTEVPDDEVQVTYKPLKSEPMNTGKLRMRPGVSGGSERGSSGHSVRSGQDNLSSGHLVDEGDEVSLCSGSASGSSRSSSRLETQV